MRVAKSPTQLDADIARGAARMIELTRVPPLLALLVVARKALGHANAVMVRDQMLRITVDIQDVLTGPLVEMFKALAALAALAETLPQDEQYVVPIPFIGEEVTGPIAKWNAGCLWRENQPGLAQRDHNILDAVSRANHPTPDGAVDLEVAPPAAELAAVVADAEREVNRLESEIARFERRRLALLAEAEQIEIEIASTHAKAVTAAIAD